jgi:hypothetical protein
MSERAIDPHAAVDYILKNASRFADAKADRVHLEEFRKSKKAMLMAESGESAVNAREQFAYAHADYVALLDGLKAAVAVEEKLKWDLIGAQLRVEIWRTESANSRMQDRSTQ